MIHLYSFRFLLPALIFVLSSFISSILSIKYKNCECGLSNNDANRIVGGWGARPHEFPWMAAIFYRGRFHCGGAVINDRYILTAGHCIQAPDGSIDRRQLSVTVGMHNSRLRDGNTVPIHSTILNENFYSHRDYDEMDIALIKLSQPLNFNQYVAPICLPKQNSLFRKFALIMGWGFVSNNGPTAQTLQQSIVHVLKPSECLRTIMRPHVTKYIICAYMDKTDSCQGDSGGPLIAVREPGKYEQIGLVSWGYECAAPNSPGIYTNVLSFLNWIYLNTQDANYCIG